MDVGIFALALCHMYCRMNVVAGLLAVEDQSLYRTSRSIALEARPSVDCNQDISIDVASRHSARSGERLSNLRS